MDYNRLLTILSSGVDESARAAYSELVDELGQDEAAALWAKACGEIDHDAHIARTVKELTDALAAATDCLRTARLALAQLTDPAGAWHPDYAEGEAGPDLARLIDFAGFNLRMATTVNNRLKAAALAEAGPDGAQ